MKRFRITAYSDIEEGDLDESNVITEEAYEAFLTISLDDLEDVTIEVVET